MKNWKKFALCALCAALAVLLINTIALRANAGGGYGAYLSAADAAGAAGVLSATAGGALFAVVCYPFAGLLGNAGAYAVEVIFLALALLFSMSISGPLKILLNSPIGFPPEIKMFF